MTITIDLDKDTIDEIELTSLIKYTEWNKNSMYFNLEAGKEHYKLIAYLSKFTENQIIDIGTYFGFSALASSLYNKPVTTYDVCDWFPEDEKIITARNNKNIIFKLMDCCNDMEEIVKSDIVLLDIDPHSGEQELVIMKALKDVGFQGIIMLDDIHLNEKMDEFWNGIEEKKIDVTSVGHFSGTGIVFYGDKYEIKLN